MVSRFEWSEEITVAASPRERLINSAIVLVQERGVDGTGLAELLTHSKTARNSVYQHFPGGKSELVEASTRKAGERTSRFIAALPGARTSDEALEAMTGWWKHALQNSSFTVVCPVAAAALAGPSSPSVRAAAGEVFAEWRQLLSAVLIEGGLAASAASSFASFAVSAIEGAIIQSRSLKSTQPLDDARANLALLLKAHHDQAAT